MFGMKTLYVGQSLDKYNKTLDILSANNIKYKTDVAGRSSQWLGQGATRSNFAMTDANIKHDTMYEIKVKKQDYEKALYLVNNE